MGSFVRALCDCGFSGGSRIGCGMLTVGKEFWFPAFCPECRELVEANLEITPPVCSRCQCMEVVPYNATLLNRLIANLKVPLVVLNSEPDAPFDLSKGKQFCPKCEKSTLRFIEGEVLWD
jgi:hypothetical protein